MSRLYLKAGMDKKWTTPKGPTRARRAHQELTAMILWGSKKVPKIAAHITVFWPVGSKEPVVTLNYERVKLFEF